MPKSPSSKSRHAPGPKSEIDRIQMQETEGLETHPFAGVENMRRILESRYSELNAGTTTDQFIAFRRVGEANLATIEAKRSRIGKFSRFTHYVDTSVLVVRIIPSSAHVVAHTNLMGFLIIKIAGMGIGPSEFGSVGATLFQCARSKKEGDSGLRPRPARVGVGSWPTLIIESGLSESLSRLRNDANWWIRNSKGQVKIVVIILIKEAEQPRAQIEKWEAAQPDPSRPSTRSNAEVPAKMQTVTIEGDTVEGAPLVLDFEKVFLRAPTPPEADFVFDTVELLEWMEMMVERIR